ncbi:MAG TPA: endolytic transglycosylase MltG [Chitinophagaceae bacterium]|nr:endolytic transglycosylase MltG [Chitinophagaceae bacterium]
MKKLIGFIFFVLIIVALVIGWKVFGPTLKQPDGKYFYIRTGSNYRTVTAALLNQKIINTTRWFNRVSKALKYQAVKPGKFMVKKGMSVFELVRTLKNDRQSPVDLVIIKFRTKEEFAHRIGKEFETDSLQMISFLNNQDSMRHYDLDTATWAFGIIPDTYTFFWNSTPTKIFSKLSAASKKFWTEDKKHKLQNNNLTALQAYILASIVEEETNLKSDKGKIASVYINRISKGMPLQADPTVKFAMKDFGLKRIYDKYLVMQSPYNTYINKGLPPGPICIPSVETLDAVIDAPKTDYMYFVANSDFSGTHIFTTNYEEHKKYAKLFADAQDRQDSIRKAKQNNP